MNSQKVDNSRDVDKDEDVVDVGSQHHGSVQHVEEYLQK